MRSVCCCSAAYPLLRRVSSSPPSLPIIRSLSVTCYLLRHPCFPLPKSFPAATRLGWDSAAGTRRLCSSIRATHVSDPGSIDSPLMQSMERKIKEQLDADSVTVKDAYGDGRHVSIDVVSKTFEGQSAVNRQRMVYKAIWEELQSTVHAVDQMTTRTPAEAAIEK